MITKEVKQKIVQAVKERLTNYNSARAMAVSMGINPAQLSRIINGELDGVLSDANWLSIARKLDVQISEQSNWITGKTFVYEYIYNQLTLLQQESLSALLCDRADIGKTYTAKQYVKENRYVVYIDCSQNKSKQYMIRAIAKEFGVECTGKLRDVYSDLIFYLKQCPNPLIILDEAGDLYHEAFLELKAMWNATEGFCGWYLMGADGLRRKIEKSINSKKVGYCEMFSRLGNRYQTITPEGRDNLNEFINTQIAVVAKVNGGNDIRQIIACTGGSLRRVKIEIKKQKA
jgi:DNA transposition AAA+ family ATPase